MEKKFKFKWGSFIGMAIVHVGALFAFATFSWPAFWTFFVLYWITIGLGITLCYHRLLAHRSFWVPKWLEYVLTLCGGLAMQGGSVSWVATHRVHHAFSDRPQDPHSPTRGFFWAHLGWMLKYDEILDHPIRHLRYAPDLAKDNVHVWLGKTVILQEILLGVFLFLLGGVSFVIWGIFLRIALGWHSTWAVNSLSHIWGYRTYETGERSTNNWFVAFLTYGEGWHNNHHAYPTSAAHGLRWWEVDLTYLSIRILRFLGAAKEIRLPRGNPTKLPPSVSDSPFLPDELNDEIRQPLLQKVGAA